MANNEKKVSSPGEADKPAWEAPVVISVEVMEVMASSCVAVSDGNPPCDGAANPGKDVACGCSTYGS